MGQRRSAWGLESPAKRVNVSEDHPMQSSQVQTSTLPSARDVTARVMSINRAKLSLTMRASCSEEKNEWFVLTKELRLRPL